MDRGCVAGSGCIIDSAPIDNLSEKDWVAKVNESRKPSATTKTKIALLEDILRWILYR